MPKVHISFEFDLPNEELEYLEIINAHKGFDVLSKLNGALYAANKRWTKRGVPLTEESMSEMINECYGYLKEVADVIE